MGNQAMKGFIAMYVLIGFFVGVGAHDADIEKPAGFPIFAGVFWPAMLSVIVTETANNINDRGK